MCGIIGISGTFSEADLEKATLKLSHRGPDDSGTYFNEDKKIGLGHTRLAIVKSNDLYVISDHELSYESQNWEWHSRFPRMNPTATPKCPCRHIQ